MRLAQIFSKWVDESSYFERAAPVPLSVVCFRANGSDNDSTTDDLNMRLLTRVNSSGEVFLSHTRLNGRYTIRLAIGHVRTTEAHVRRAWELLNEARREIGA
jgi:aromatic-L-amino-acid decarboxylase